MRPEDTAMAGGDNELGFGPEPMSHDTKPTSAKVADLRDALDRLCAVIEGGWIPPDDVVDHGAWDAACQAYRDSGAYSHAKFILAAALPQGEAGVPEGDVGRWMPCHDVTERQVAWIDREAKHVAVVVKGYEYILHLPPLPDRPAEKVKP